MTKKAKQIYSQLLLKACQDLEKAPKGTHVVIDLAELKEKAKGNSGGK